MWLLTYLRHGRQKAGALRKHQRQEKGRQKAQAQRRQGRSFRRGLQTSGQNRQKEVMDIRSEVINKLRTAVSQATAGEIHRAVEFLAFAREVRVGKHDLRRKGRVLTQQVRGGEQ